MSEQHEVKVTSTKEFIISDKKCRNLGMVVKEIKLILEYRDFVFNSNNGDYANAVYECFKKAPELVNDRYFLDVMYKVIERSLAVKGVLNHYTAYMHERQYDWFAEFRYRIYRDAVIEILRGYDSYCIIRHAELARGHNSECQYDSKDCPLGDFSEGKDTLKVVAAEYTCENEVLTLWSELGYLKCRLVAYYFDKFKYKVYEQLSAKINGKDCKFYFRGTQLNSKFTFEYNGKFYRMPMYTPQGVNYLECIRKGWSFKVAD